jgi:hypothetical protein
MSDINLTLTNASPISLSFDCPATFEEWASTLTEYSSDAEAGTGGVAIGAFYLTSDSHDSMPGGVAKQRRS